MLDMFANQSWFQIAGEVVLIFTTITASLPDRWVSSIPVLGKMWPIFNWLSGNVFHNINHPKGMAVAKEVEKEIDDAKAKVRDRVGINDTLAGM